MTHGRLERQLSAYLDNELTADEAQDVRAHLERCRSCREELARFRRMKQVLAALPEVNAPEDLWNALRQRLHEPAARRARYNPSALVEVVWSVMRRPAAAVAAAALVIMVIAFPLVRGRIDRLRAADVGVDVYVREHALLSITDPFADRAYLGLLISDANRALVGEPRREEEER